jgi:hypothetical protein
LVGGDAVLEVQQRRQHGTANSTSSVRRGAARCGAVRGAVRCGAVRVHVCSSIRTLFGGTNSGWYSRLNTLSKLNGAPKN